MTETIKIKGMSCSGCVASVRSALGRAGVEKADVTIGSAEIEYDESRVSHEQIVEAIEDAGYEMA